MKLLPNNLSREEILEDLGWIQFSDTQYTQASPLTILANTRTVLPNNKGSVLNTNGPPGAENWLDLNAFKPDSPGDFYVFRLSFVADPTLNNRNLVLDLDIGGSQGIIWSQTIRLARGAGVDTRVSVTIPVYALNTFVVNGGLFNINCDGDVNVYGVVWVPCKVFKA